MSRTSNERDNNIQLLSYTSIHMLVAHVSYHCYYIDYCERYENIISIWNSWFYPINFVYLRYFGKFYIHSRVSIISFVVCYVNTESMVSLYLLHAIINSIWSFNGKNSMETEFSWQTFEANMHRCKALLCLFMKDGCETI